MVRPTRVRRLRIRRAAHASVLVVGIMLAGSALSFAWHKDVTLVVGGTPEAIRTTSSNVEGLLRSQGVPLSVGLQVVPPPGTALADGMTVVVSPPPGMPADAFRAAVGPQGVGVWVVEQPGAAPFGKTVPAPGQATANAAGVGPSVVSVRAVVSGKVHDVSTNAGTVGALLSAMGIQPDADDRVAPPPSTPLLPGSLVRFDSREVFSRRWIESIPFAFHTRYSSRLAPGAASVVRHGAPGIAQQVVRVTVVNGVITSRVVLSRSVLRAPITEEVLAAPMAMSDGTLAEPSTGATTQRGLATWYDPPWSGLTAAHPWLPFGTRVTVTDLETGRSVTVVIDDRGPFAPGRVIDLSPEAFARLQPLGHGVLDVSLSW